MPDEDITPKKISPWLLRIELNWEIVYGWPRNFKFSFEKCMYYFEIAVILAIVAIKKCVPSVITTYLALSTRKIAYNNVMKGKTLNLIDR